MPCKLAVTFPELVEGEVNAAVVDHVPGDGLRVSLGNTIMQHALTQNYHDPLPVTARYLDGQGVWIKVSRKGEVFRLLQKQVETGGDIQHTGVCSAVCVRQLDRTWSQRVHGKQWKRRCLCTLGT